MTLIGCHKTSTQIDNIYGKYLSAAMNFVFLFDLQHLNVF